MSVRDEIVLIKFLLSVVQFLMRFDGGKFVQMCVKFEHGSYTCSGDNAIVIKGDCYETDEN